MWWRPTLPAGFTDRLDVNADRDTMQGPLLAAIPGCHLDLILLLAVVTQLLCVSDVTCCVGRGETRKFEFNPNWFLCLKEWISSLVSYKEDIMRWALWHNYTAASSRIILSELWNHCYGKCKPDWLVWEIKNISMHSSVISMFIYLHKKTNFTEWKSNIDSVRETFIALNTSERMWP